MVHGVKDSKLVLLIFYLAGGVKWMKNIYL